MKKIITVIAIVAITSSAAMASKAQDTRRDIHNNPDKFLAAIKENSYKQVMHNPNLIQAIKRGDITTLAVETYTNCVARNTIRALLAISESDWEASLPQMKKLGFTEAEKCNYILTDSNDEF